MSGVVRTAEQLLVLLIYFLSTDMYLDNDGYFTDFVLEQYLSDIIKLVILQKENDKVRTTGLCFYVEPELYKLFN